MSPHPPKAYFQRLLRLLPCEYSSVDSSRITIIYFCLSALDLLGHFKQSTAEHTLVFDECSRRDVCNYILSLQCFITGPSGEKMCGFRGGTFAGNPFNVRGSLSISLIDQPNLAMTYAALLALKILDYKYPDDGDDGRDSLLAFVRSLQLPDGSFAPSPHSREADIRFVYCAHAICNLLDGWHAINLSLSTQFIHSCRTYDGGYAQVPGMESHGGSTYCALASLSLANRLEQEFKRTQDRRRTVRWLVARQSSEDGGLCGRVNKPSDTCYSFWIGASLQILGGQQSMIDAKRLSEFLGQTRSPYGGHGKEPGDYPDALHSYMALAGWSTIVSNSGGNDCENDEKLLPLDGTLNILQARLLK